MQAVKEQLKGYEKGYAAGGKTKNKGAEMDIVQAQLKGYSEVCFSASLRPSMMLEAEPNIAHNIAAAGHCQCALLQINLKINAHFSGTSSNH